MPNDQIPEGFNTPVPSKILTPDHVDSRIGSLDFVDGVPTADTAGRVFDHLDFLRGVEVFLNCIPAASIEAMRMGFLSEGVDACNKLLIMDELLDSGPFFLTGNTDTVYCGGFLDLEQDGPTVVEIPPGCGPGTVNDAWFRFVIDMGGPGPDRGQGGKYLITPPGYDGEIPDGYFVAESASYSNWIILRGFLVDGKPDAATEMFTEGVKIYPLSRIDDQPQMEFISTAGKLFNTVHANDSDFYAELAPVIHREPIDMLDPETRGLLAAIGIHKDKPFAPDERMQRILVEAAEVGNATARSLYFRWRGDEQKIYNDRQWHTFFIGGDYQWLRDEGPRRSPSRRPHFLLLRRYCQHAGDGVEARRYRLAVRRGRHRQRWKLPRRVQVLPADASGKRASQELLVDLHLRPTDPVRAADLAALPQPQQRTRRTRVQQRRFSRHPVRARTTSRAPEQLDPNRPRKGLVHDPPDVRPTRTLVRPHLEARRHRADLELTLEGNRTPRYGDELSERR